MFNRTRFARRAGVGGLSLTVVALLALSIIGVSGAYAKEEFTRPPRIWYTGAQPGTKLVGTRAVTMGVASGSLEFNSSIGGVPIEWSATGVECLNCTIVNEGSSKAMFHGQLVFTGEKWLGPEPGRCSMPSTVRSKPLTGEVGGRLESSSIAALVLRPTEGPTWWTYEIRGAECPFAGLYKRTGSAFSEFVNPLGVASKTQKIKFSKAIQDSLGLPTDWKFGENPAYMTGEINISSEVEYQVKES